MLNPDNRNVCALAHLRDCDDPSMVILIGRFLCFWFSTDLPTPFFRLKFYVLIVVKSVGRFFSFGVAQ